VAYFYIKIWLIFLSQIFVFKENKGKQGDASHASIREVIDYGKY
jgi:hypothetical protein